MLLSFFPSWSGLRTFQYPYIYRVIHKSVKHFKNSQQINYSTDHGSSYADRETLQVFLHISQMLNVSTFGNTADIYAIVHLIPHACQNITVNQSHSSGDTVAKIWRLAGSGGTKTVSFANPRRKSCTGLNPGTRVATTLTRHLRLLCVLSTFVASFDSDTLAHLCSEPKSRRVERCNHYCLHSTVASASFLTCFTDLWKTLCVYIYIYKDFY